MTVTVGPLALGAVLLAASVGAAGGSEHPTPAQSRWVVKDPSSTSWAVGINESGQVVGSDFLWSGGKTITLPTLGGWRVTAIAVNARGQVVGNSVTGADAPVPRKPHAFMWEHGTMLDLTPAAHPNAQAFAINDRGQIVGYEGTSMRNGNGDPVKAAFLWRGGRLTTLRRLRSATDNTAFAINGRGQIVGWSGPHAVVWYGTGARDLGTLPGDEFSRAVAINEHGQIIGWSSKARSAEKHGVLWSDGQTVDLGGGRALDINERGQVMGNGYLWDHGHRVPLDIDYEYAINDRGQIVGESRNSAVVWHDGHTTTLPGLGGKESWATDINNRGQIVGVATTKNGAQHAVLWSPAR